MNAIIGAEQLSEAERNFLLKCAEEMPGLRWYMPIDETPKRAHAFVPNVPDGKPKARVIVERVRASRRPRNVFRFHFMTEYGGPIRIQRSSIFRSISRAMAYDAVRRGILNNRAANDSFRLKCRRKWRAQKDAKIEAGRLLLEALDRRGP